MGSRSDEATAKFLEEYADFLESHVEAWTVTTEGTLVPGIKRHYIRILPSRIDDPHPVEDPNKGNLSIANHPPGAQNIFPGKEIVDAGFLQLVRHGIRKADDAVIVDSVRAVDATLKVDTPFGPCWHRYNHDGYGQREDGGAFEGWGTGRAWPLLTGERGHYELAAAHDVKPFIKALEGFGSIRGLLPEQVWDQPDRPDIYMRLGGPTGSAMPLMWAHAEYIKLLRSTFDGKVFDVIPEVASRYLGKRGSHRQLEIWKFNRQTATVKRAYTLRILVPAPFRLHWSDDQWQTAQDTMSSSTAIGIEYVDIPVKASQKSPLHFTFFWKADSRWENRDYVVAMA